MILKIILLVLICGLTVYLLIDTTIFVVRKIKERRKARKEIKDTNKTE